MHIGPNFYYINLRYCLYIIILVHTLLITHGPQSVIFNSPPLSKYKSESSISYITAACQVVCTENGECISSQ